MTVQNSPTSSAPVSRGRWSRAVVALWVLIVALALFLLIAEKPWNLGLREAITSGGRVPLPLFIAEGLWLGALANLLAALCLVATNRWWLAPVPELPDPSRRAVPLWFWLVLLLVVADAAAVRYPRLLHSLWNDEEYTLRRYVFGAFDERDTGELRFKKVGWSTSLFYNRGANNHVCFSLAGKMALKLWAGFGATRERPFSEAALRMPAYLASLATIALAAVMLAGLGRPMLGLFSAAFLAIHPWHLRYSVEARGYSAMLLFALFSVWFLTRALNAAHWRPWLLFGLCQFLYMWCFPGAIYLALALNLTAAILLLQRREPWPDRFRRLGRLGVAGVLSAMAFLQLMGPSFRQIRLYLARDIARGEMGTGWLLDVWSHLTAGLRYYVHEPDTPLALGLNMMIGDRPALRWFFFVVIPALALLGIVRALTVGRQTILLVVPFLAAGLLAYAHTSLTGNFLFSWYLLYLLPGFAAALFLAWELPVAGVRTPWRRNTFQAAGGLAFLGVYLLATIQPRTLIRDHDREPLRQTIEAMRSDPFGAPATPPVLTVAFGTSCRQLQSYDPRILPLDAGDDRDVAALEEEIRRADGTGSPLLVACAGREELRRAGSRLLAMVEDPEKFRHVATVQGLEEMFTFRVFRRLPPAELRQAAKTSESEPATPPVATGSEVRPPSESR